MVFAADDYTYSLPLVDPLKQVLDELARRAAPPVDSWVAIDGKIALEDSRAGAAPSRIDGQMELVQRVPPGAASGWTSIEGNILLEDSRGRSLRGRGNIARCFGGQFCAVTVRRDPGDKGDLARVKLVTTDCRATGGWDQCDSTAAKENLVGLGAVCDEVHNLTRSDPLCGLVVISGSTNSAKSRVARGLVAKLLHGITPRKRRPHILTLEDPAENYAFGEPVTRASKPRGAAAAAAQRRRALSKYLEHVREKHGFDYTVRELGVDCPSITAGLQDARRQTPTVVYIGEVRRHEDWETILEFAGSGHLVVTTTHAGSLLETLQTILNAVSANTPAQVGFAAQRVLAAVHLAKLPSPEEAQSALVPSVWRRSSSSVAQLVADGLSSIVPGNPTVGAARGSADCFGRVWFANKMKPSAKDLAKPKVAKGRRKIEEAWQKVLAAAYKSDITGI